MLIYFILQRQSHLVLPQIKPDLLDKLTRCVPYSSKRATVACSSSGLAFCHEAAGQDIICTAMTILTHEKHSMSLYHDGSDHIWTGRDLRAWHGFTGGRATCG